MTCDELELLLPEGADEAAAQAHLATCANCRETMAALTAAAQPPLTRVEKTKLEALPSAVQAEWTQRQHRRGMARTVVGFAIAASLGAVVASGLMWRLNPALPAEPELLVLWEDSESLLIEEDESSFEVSWPSLIEQGDVR